MEKSKKIKWAMPDAFIIIFGIVILAAIATYLIPAGSYQRETVNGLNRVVPNSFNYVAQNPASLMDVFYAIPVGLKQSASIIFLIFMIGGAIAIYDRTRAIDSGINALIVKTKGNYQALIITVAFIFGMLSSLGLAANAVIAFIPIGIALSRSMKLDAITGVAVVYLGYYAGNAVGVLDPTILGTAQTLAEVPLFSGVIFRVVLFAILIVVTIAYIVWYARRIANDPTTSYMYGIAKDDPDYEQPHTQSLDSTFSLRQKLSLVVFIAFIGLFLYGAFEYKWGIEHLSAIFIMMSIVVAAMFKIAPNDYIKTFMKGAQSLVYGALVVGIARAVIVILDEGRVLDSIVQATLVPLQQTSHFGALNYFISLIYYLTC
ncbi:YfcC family protein [Proteus mirabilis]